MQLKFYFSILKESHELPVSSNISMKVVIVLCPEIANRISTLAVKSLTELVDSLRDILSLVCTFFFNSFPSYMFILPTSQYIMWYTTGHVCNLSYIIH